MNYQIFLIVQGGLRLFPMVYLSKKYLGKQLEASREKFDFSAVGSTGILAGAAKIIAMFRLIKEMTAADKVKCIAFAVCSAFLIGDHLAFTANFQPTLIVPLMVGKLSAGLIAVGIAMWLSVPKAIKLEQEELNK